MSYIKQKDEGVPADNIEGTIAPDQVAYGDPDNSGKIKGSDNFTFVDETAGSGPTVELTGDSPQLDMQDDTAATDYKTRFKQSGASLFVFGQDSTGTDVEMIRAQPTSIVFNDDGNNLDFRHEAQGGGALLWSDAGRKSIGIGTQPDSAVQRLHVDGDSTDTSTTDPVVLIENDASGRTFTALELKNKSDDNDSSVTLRMTSLAGTDSDFEITHDAFGGTTFVSSQPGTLTRRNLVMSNSIFNVNADQADIDTQIETTGVAAMFHVDSANDVIGIGGVASSNVERLDIQGTETGTRTVRISTNAPVAEKGVNGPYFDLRRTNSDDVGQVNSNLGIMRWIGEDSASNDTVYAYIAAEIYDPTNGSEDGVLKFNIMDGGTGTEYIRLTARDAASPDFKGVIINETSADVSFRVESNGVNPAFMVDAGTDIVTVGSNPQGTASANGTFQVRNKTISSYAYLGFSNTAVTTEELNNDRMQSQLIVHKGAADHTYELPTGVQGMYFKFVSTGGNITIQPDTGDTINGGTAGSPVTRSTDNQIYECVCYEANKWIVSNP